MKKDKVFFFFNYEGVQQRSANTYLLSVPQPEWLTGDFSNLRDQNGNLIQVFDPLTTCGKFNNPACATDASGNPIYTRQPFVGNKIPANRLDKTAMLLAPKIWGLPNLPGNAYTHANNFVNNSTVGSRTGQYNWRIDYNLNDKQRIFGRWMIARNNPFQDHGLGTEITAAANEYAMSQQGVVGDTYTFNPSTVLDLRLGFVRNTSNRIPSELGTDLAAAYGWPTALNQEIINHTIPMPYLPDFDWAGHLSVSDPATIIVQRSNVYSLIGSLTKTWGAHNVKFGGEVRDIQFNFFQANQTSGQFNFNNQMTAINPLAPAGTGYSFASYMLGDGASGYILNGAFAASTEKYMGWYVMDTFAVTKRLTLTYGLRWELPGTWTERHDRNADFLPDAPSPFAAVMGMPNLKGKLAMVNTPDRPDRHSIDYPYNKLSPRIGLAYRLTDRVVIRSGYSLAYLPADSTFSLDPHANAVNLVQTNWVPSLDGGITPYATLNNPFPNGILTPLKHSDDVNSILLGQDPAVELGNNPFAYNQQWTFGVENQLTEGLMVGVAYAGAKGTHLPTYEQTLNELPDQYLSMGAALAKVVPNPLYGTVQYGTLSAATTTLGQLLRPFPQFDNVNIIGMGNRDTTYNAMQMRVEKRFKGGSSISAAYVFMKLMGSTDSMAAWSEVNYGGGNYVTQDYNNVRAEKSITQGDLPHRLVASYVLDMPIGKGHKLFSGVTGPLDKLISGWVISGITSFQSGFPISLTDASDLTGDFNTGAYTGVQRPNRIVLGDASIHTCAQCKLNKWFHTENFAPAPAYTFGDVGRILPDIRSAGLNNWDFAVLKNIKVTERVGIQFRSEFFNLFNRAQMAMPGSVVGTASFGVVSAQGNSPRNIEFGLRLSF